MNRIHLVGQVITCTNYTTQRLFNFNPEPLRAAAEYFLAGGVTEIEIPQGVLDPNGRFPETGVDEETLAKTVAGLPSETKVLGSYIGGRSLGADNAAFVKSNRKVLEKLISTFPDLRYAMLHPPGKGFDSPEAVKGTIDAYAQCAEYAAKLRPGFELCFHNHYDTSAETADQVTAHLVELEKVNLPSLRWGPDTGHCHGMKDQYLPVLKKYAHLIGRHFHIKAQVPAFDRLHGGDKYVQERDIWSNKAEIGGGLYAGFVNVGDPEIVTPFKQVFDIIRKHAKPSEGVVYGAMEIDIPRQHPKLEVLCGVLYLKNVHGIETGLNLSNDQIINRILK